MSRLSEFIRVGFIIGCLLLIVSAGSAIGQTLEKQSDGSIEVTCPNEIRIAPVNLPSGWATFGSPLISFSMLSVNGDNSVGCWYGKTEVTLVIIGTTFEAGYKCKALDPAFAPKTAICIPPQKPTNRRRNVRERARPR